jgi:hypothetical protein
MCNNRAPLESPPRPNRISFYVFNPQGGLGVGSYVQVKVAKGHWMHVVGMADDKCTYFYENGQYVRYSTYRGPAQGECEIQEQNGTQVVINPQPGSAALRLGTKDLGSFLEGGLSRVRLWNRTLTATEVSSLYAIDTAPRDGLVAEFLLNAIPAQSPTIRHRRTRDPSSMLSGQRSGSRRFTIREAASQRGPAECRPLADSGLTGSGDWHA